MKKIAFYLPHLDLQGTGVATYDYAFFNETMLGNKSFIFWDEYGQYGKPPWTHPLAVEKFKNTFSLYGLTGQTQEQNMNELENKCKELQVDAVYIHKTGLRSDRFVKNIPTFIHACGVVNEPHGTVYAYVSEWLSVACTQGQAPFVPLMVNLPDIKEDLRNELNIPQNAVVFGRTGGTYSWNLPFVNQAIQTIVQKRSDIYFLFANTDKFIEHKQVIFHQPFTDLVYNRKFINTCDAMIHARAEGESFGLSCAEFSSCNKPIITYLNSPEQNHILTLKEKGIYYTNTENLLKIFENFTPTNIIDYNAYQTSTPFEAMKKFKEIFIDIL